MTKMCVDEHIGARRTGMSAPPKTVCVDEHIGARRTGMSATADGG
ncbi:MAG TPA: hypothetical protein VGQ99_20510 [Tepidisphaeraceae bacterium]|nr:hypothetical protein [Tepidisphaeraceae bacterium]